MEDVFEVLADYEAYVQFPGVRSAKVVRLGSAERNGLGAVREVDLGSAWFREEITAFERPTRLDYRILKSRPPMEHEGGSIRLRSVEGGTEVTWTSTLRVTYPIVGGLVTLYVARRLGQGFDAALTITEQRAAARG